MNVDAAEEELYGSIERVDISEQEKPVLIVVIDTEEEFPWEKPHNRNNTSISAINELAKVQKIFDSRGVIPCYVIDYPVASNNKDNKLLRRISDDGCCVIGLHLHPWVSPPHTEEVNRVNSFPGNLKKALELEKLSLLKEEIEKNFSITVNTYKAGRYGVGINTAGCLAELGINIDLSPTPGFDYRNDGGPDFSRFTNRLFSFGPNSRQLCIPCTGGVIGWGGGQISEIYEYLNCDPWLSMRAPGIAARLGFAERIRLSPEGYSLDEMKRVTRSLLQSGERVFTLSFHSPSVKPGCTPYVKSEEDLTLFLGRIQGYLDYFQNVVKGEFMHPERIYQIHIKAKKSRFEMPII